MTTQLLRLNNRLGMRLFGIVLSAVMLFIFLAAQPARAEQRPDTILHETVDQLLAKLDSNRSALAADKCQLYSLVNRLVLPLFTVDKISRLILGAHFKTASPDLRNRFTRAFMGLMIRTYATAMFEYTGQEEIEYLPFVLDESARTALVQTRVRVSGQVPVPVDYAFLRSVDGRWQIYDVRLDGISLVLSYRRSYDQIIRSKGLEVLVHALETQDTDC